MRGEPVQEWGEMKKYGIVMAGGGGTRFWPLSRQEEPKQLLNLSGKDTMVNETIDRFAGVVDQEDIFIVTNVTQAPKMTTVTSGRVRADHILAEPAARNTAACIGYAAMEIVRKYEDGVMCIVPSDHFIKNIKEYKNIISAAMTAAEQTDKLVTIGIRPDFPSTGYGYIRSKKGSEEVIPGYDKTYATVEEFVEKPDRETAASYLAAGNYVWNSGMFIWKASTILKQFELLLPDVYACLCEIGDAMGTPAEKETIERVYPVIPKISIDYGIMERAKEVLVMEGDFGWNDVGSLDMLTLVRDTDENGNVIYGEQLNLDTEGCISYGTDKLVATVGVKDLIIVQTSDAILICDKKRAQDVKLVVDELRAQGKHEYL